MESIPRRRYKFHTPFFDALTQLISQDKQKRLEYEAREKAIRDYNQSIYEAQRRGHKQGLQQKLISQIEKKMKKNKTIEQIADDLEESIETVTTIYNDLKKKM